jgi:hypothetical protein
MWAIKKNFSYFKYVAKYVNHFYYLHLIIAIYKIGDLLTWAKTILRLTVLGHP